MTNIGLDGAINSTTSVANQLRFITTYQNGAAPQGLMQQTPAINTLNQDTVNFSDKYAADDGKISFKDKVVNFAKGVISPVTAMFSSPKNFAIGTIGIIGSGLLVAATGGAIAPVMVALGAAAGVIGLIKNSFSAINAKTDDEARKAWQGLGLNSTVAIGSIAGSKAALKGAGIDTKNMNIISATLECFKKVPTQVGKSVHAFKSGEALINIKNVFHINKKDAKASDSSNVGENGGVKAESTGKTGKQAEDIKQPVDIQEQQNVETQTETVLGDAPKATDAADISANPEGLDPATKNDAPIAPKKTKKPRRTRKSRVKRQIDQKQAEQVKKEAKDIAAILDELNKSGKLDGDLADKISSVRRIAENPMANSKKDTGELISTVRYLESCKNAPEEVCKNIDFPFDETISYIEELLLKHYNIERITAKIGDVFNPKLMQGQNTATTSNPSLQNTIFEILFPGFKQCGRNGTASDWKLKVGYYTAS